MRPGTGLVRHQLASYMSSGSVGIGTASCPWHSWVTSVANQGRRGGQGQGRI